MDTALIRPSQLCFLFAFPAMKTRMPRFEPLPPETTPELKDHFDFFLGTLGFTPNSVLPMQRKPKLVQAFAQLNAAVMDPAGKVDLGIRRLIGHVASKASGCLNCQAHTLLGAQNFGVSDQKLNEVWNFPLSRLYRERERVNLLWHRRHNRMQSRARCFRDCACTGARKRFL